MSSDNLQSVHPEQEEADLRLFRNLEFSPEEFAARYGHEFAMFPFHQYRYRRPGMIEWVQKLAKVFFAPGLPMRVEMWEEPVGEVEWQKCMNELPRVEELIEVIQPEEHSSWLTLQGYYKWEQETPVGEDRYYVKRRQIGYTLNSYIVKQPDSKKMLTWAKKQSWMGRRMPESSESYTLLLGEFFWSPAFEEQNCYYFGRPGWTRGNDDQIPAEVLLASDGYARESGGYDCSLEDTIFIDLPCKLIVDGLGLTWRGVEGYWFNKGGQLTAFDPSVRTHGPHVTLVRRDALIDFLDSNDLTLFWTVFGEKRIVGGGMSDREYNGRLEINGAFILDNGLIKGQRTAKFVSPESEMRARRVGTVGRRKRR